MFIVVVVVFAIFMFPNQVVWLWADFGGGINSPNFTKLSIICWLFTYTNCVVNPVIFGVFSKDFRKGFKRIFKSIMCCERSALKDSTERLQFQTITKTGSDSTESNTVDCEKYGKDSNLTFLSIQDGEQTTGIQTKPNKQFQEKTTTLNGLPLQKIESFSNGHEKPHQSITSMLTSFEPEGESRHLNDDHSRMTYGRQWNVLPHCISCSETLKNALNSSRETYC